MKFMVMVMVMVMIMVMVMVMVRFKVIIHVVKIVSGSKSCQDH